MIPRMYIDHMHNIIYMITYIYIYIFVYYDVYNIYIICVYIYI